MRARLSTNTLHGDKQTSSTDLANDPVHLTSRTFSNFTEHVPMLLLMSSVIEINGGNRTYLTYGLATFMALRLSHVFGFGQGVIAFRAAGEFGAMLLRFERCSGCYGVYADNVAFRLLRQHCSRRYHGFVVWIPFQVLLGLLDEESGVSNTMAAQDDCL